MFAEAQPLKRDRANKPNNIPRKDAVRNTISRKDAKAQRKVRSTISRKDAKAQRKCDGALFTTKGVP